MIPLYEHPLSPYAQKVKIALREKGIPFETLMPGGRHRLRGDGTFRTPEPRLLVGGAADVYRRRHAAMRP